MYMPSGNSYQEGTNGFVYTHASVFKMKFQHVNILMSLCETLIEHLILCKFKGIFMILFYAKRILEIFQKDSFRNDDHLVDWQTSELNYVLMFYRFILFK